MINEPCHSSIVRCIINLCHHRNDDILAIFTKQDPCKSSQDWLFSPQNRLILRILDGLQPWFWQILKMKVVHLLEI